VTPRIASRPIRRDSVTAATAASTLQNVAHRGNTCEVKAVRLAMHLQTMTTRKMAGGMITTYSLWRRASGARARP
jgi:hypothetical protein